MINLEGGKHINRTASSAAAIVVLISILSSASCLRTVRASETIYIRADGSIDPATVPIQINGNVYTLTENINSDVDGIVVERNHTVLNGGGHTLQGTKTPSSKGLYLSESCDVTIRDLSIKGFELAILLDTYSSGNQILGNKVEDNEYGISCWAYSDSNSIIGNNITANNLAGIWIVGSSNNTIAENIISGNNQYGISLEGSSNNTLCHNSFIDNTNQIYIYDSISTWDNGYPSGGNYWSDYSGNDAYSGPFQNETGSDGIGDTPYNFSENDQDRYPLMKAWTNIAVQTVSPYKTVVGQGQNVTITVSVQNQGWDAQTTNITVYVNTTIVSTFKNVTIVGRGQATLNFTWQTGTFSRGNYVISAQADPALGETDTTDNTFQNWIIVTITGDINGDGTVDIYDAISLAGAFNSVPGSSSWKPNADINGDDTVDIYDAIILAGSFGKKS